jgi:hypothetical protein
MVKRLVVGLIIGLFVGALVAAALIKGLGITSFADGASGTAMAYIFAAVTGALTGLVAGKPIWSSNGKIEASLKAFFGALLAAGGMFALQKWVGASVNLDAIGAGSGALNTLPAASLPLVGALLGMVFELDNTGDEEAKSGKRVAEMRHEKTGPSKAKSGAGKAAAADEDEEDDEAVPGRRARR